MLIFYTKSLSNWVWYLDFWIWCLSTQAPNLVLYHVNQFPVGLSQFFVRSVELYVAGAGEMFS
jgi:hypothetical protein